MLISSLAPRQPFSSWNMLFCVAVSSLTLDCAFVCCVSFCVSVCRNEFLGLVVSGCLSFGAVVCLFCVVVCTFCVVVCSFCVAAFVVLFWNV